MYVGWMEMNLLFYEEGSTDSFISSALWLSGGLKDLKLIWGLFTHFQTFLNFGLVKIKATH